MTDLSVDKEHHRMQVEADRLPVNLEEAIGGMSIEEAQQAVFEILFALKDHRERNIRRAQDQFHDLALVALDLQERRGFRYVLKRLMEDFEHNRLVEWWSKELMSR